MSSSSSNHRETKERQAPGTAGEKPESPASEEAAGDESESNESEEEDDDESEEEEEEDDDESESDESEEEDDDDESDESEEEDDDESESPASEDRDSDEPPAATERRSDAAKRREASRPAAAGPRWLQWFWLSEELQRAQREVYGPSAPGWDDFELGCAVQAAAQRLEEHSDMTHGVALLYKGAAQSLIRARLAREGYTPGATLDQAAWDELRRRTEHCAWWKELSADQVTAVPRVVTASGTSVPAGSSKAELHSAIRGMRELSRYLQEELVTDAEKVGRVALRRWLRLSAAAVVLLAVLGGLVLLIVTGESAPTNFAEDAVVSASSRDPTYGRPPEAVVDGDRTGFGFHTRKEQNPWLLVNLQRPVRATQIVVYNRTDCCQERSVPLTVLTSLDGKQFTRLATRKEPFDVWQIPVNRELQYVRFRADAATVFHLAEIEVY